MVPLIEIIENKYIFRCGVCGWESGLMSKDTAFHAPRPAHECKKQGGDVDNEPAVRSVREATED
jgi:hypothetical protein